MIALPRESTTYYCPGSDTWNEGWSYITLSAEIGLVSIYGDFISASYIWPQAYRSTDLVTFLKGLSRDYFMGKIMGRQWMVEDMRKTLNNAKLFVMRQRRDSEIQADEARDAFETLNGLYHCTRMDQIYAVNEHTVLSEFFHNEEPALLPNPMGLRFWNEIWVPFIASL